MVEQLFTVLHVLFSPRSISPSANFARESPTQTGRQLLRRHQLTLPDGSSQGSSPAEEEEEVGRLSGQVRTQGRGGEERGGGRGGGGEEGRGGREGGGRGGEGRGRGGEGEGRGRGEEGRGGGWERDGGGGRRLRGGRKEEEGGWKGRGEREVIIYRERLGGRREGGDYCPLLF